MHVYSQRMFLFLFLNVCAKSAFRLFKCVFFLSPSEYFPHFFVSPHEMKEEIETKHFEHTLRF